MNSPTSLEYFQLFNTRREYFRLLLNLSRRQAACVQNDQYEELLDVLGQKQRILGCLDQLGKQQGPRAQNWPADRDRYDAETKNACDEILAETEAILAELLNEESASTAQLTARRDTTRRQLMAVSRGTQVHAAYHHDLNAQENSPLHLDINQ